MYPDLILGNPDKKTKRGKKAKKINANYHTDAVMSLSWNKNHRNMLASSSADTTVKIWDLASASCVRSFEHHKDKVQSVLWHPVESTVMLTGGYDKVIAAFDSRSPENISTWSIDSDVECIKWDPFQPQQFYVSTEAGTVLCFDVRNPNSAPIFTLHALDSPVSAMDVNLVVPGLLVTGSTDKIVKVWDIKENKPSMVTSRNLDVGKIFSASFCPDSAFQLGVAGSKGEVHIWDLATNPGIRRSFEGRGIAPGAAAVEIEEKPTLTLPADDSESEDDEEMEAEADEDDDESMDI
ncbi:rRNA-processing protein [Basidiobolus ranarum]|uniref:rRNA-processing protein n=1 Tax=Basidiobolus ranarum TaxID=34480 RepID=A0ABR2WMT0_9FUNG